MSFQNRFWIPLLILSGFATDLLLKWRAPLWVIGLITGVLSVTCSYPIVFSGPINWYPQALLIGWPLGLLLAILLAYVGAGVAGALGPKTKQLAVSKGGK